MALRLLNRYLLRQLVAPFFFALAALTGFMLISQVAKKFGALVGKGLPWSVITEVFVLSLPFIIAMTLPMAVLLAVLYTFSHLAGRQRDHRHAGERHQRVPDPGPGARLGHVHGRFNLAFVDQVLPRSNARLRSLLIDIGRKKAAFGLREQVINEVPPSKYFIRASRIDAATGRLKGVTIYDVGGEASRRIIYADSGSMAYCRGANRSELAPVRRVDPPVSPRRAHPLSAHLLHGERHPGQERLRRAPAKHQRIHSRRPRDEHLRDAGGRARSQAGAGGGKAGAGRAGRPRPARVAGAPPDPPAAGGEVGLDCRGILQLVQVGPGTPPTGDGSRPRPPHRVQSPKLPGHPRGRRCRSPTGPR